MQWCSKLKAFLIESLKWGDEKAFLEFKWPDGVGGRKLRIGLSIICCPSPPPSRHYSIGKFFTKSYKFNFFESFGLSIICCPSPHPSRHYSIGKIFTKSYKLFFFELFGLFIIYCCPPATTNHSEKCCENLIFFESYLIVDNMLPSPSFSRHWC